MVVVVVVREAGRVATNEGAGGGGIKFEFELELANSREAGTKFDKPALLIRRVD